MSLKYIMVDNAGTDTPILFPGWMKHDRVAAMLCTKCLSAGFVRFTDGEVQTHGKSESLRIGTRSEDAAIIASAHGMDLW